MDRRIAKLRGFIVKAVLVSSYLHHQKTHPLLVMMATCSRADTLSTPMKSVTEVT